jgi:hypothetical protein
MTILPFTLDDIDTDYIDRPRRPVAYPTRPGNRVNRVVHGTRRMA